MMSIPRLFLYALSLICLQARAENSAALPSLAGNLICYYDFDHPAQGNPAMERDLGLSGTSLHLINGGAAMRTLDAAYTNAGNSLQTRQVDAATEGNDDWKAGVYDPAGVTTLQAFNGAAGITLMGWIKPTGRNPSPDTTSEEPADLYGATGLFGLLSGTSEGHLVRALLEIIQVGEAQRLVALGRRIDEGNSMILAADGDWHVLLPVDTWIHLAATFDFDEGSIALFRNGEALPASYTTQGDPWRVAGEPEPDRSSATDPTGIKVGGSFPQNNSERNAFNGRFDDLMLFNRALTPAEVKAQFLRFAGMQVVSPTTEK